MANPFEIQVKAILESSSITQKLKEIESNLKPLKINLDLSGFGSGATSGIQGGISGIASSLDNAGDSAQNFGSKLSNTYNVGKDGAEKLKSATEAVKQSLYETITTTETYDKDQNLLATTVTKTSDGIRAQADAVKQASQARKDYSQYLKQEESATESLNNKEASVSQQYQNRLVSNSAAIQTLTIRMSGLTSAQKEQTNAEQRLQEIKTTTNVTQQAQAIRSLTSDVNAASRGMNTFAAQIEYTTERFLQIGIVVGTFRLLKNAISSIIDVVKNLNSSLVELQKVTDLEGSSLEEFTQQAYSVGATLARTGQEVIDATTVFSRAGYEIKDALDLADSALLLNNVADGITSVSDASSILISVLKAFNMEATDSAHIVDALNEVKITASLLRN